MVDLRNAKEIELMEVPLYLSVSAGLGCETCQEPVDWIMVPKVSGDIVAIKVNGDSMENTISDGATILVKKDVMVEVGEIGVFLTTGTEYPNGLVKRLRHKNGKYVLESDNKIYKDIEINTKDIKACGKVIFVINDTTKKGKDPLLASIDRLDESQRSIIETLIKSLVNNKK